MAQNYQHWKYEVDSSQIVWLTIDRKDTNVNSLSREVIAEFDAILDEIKSNTEYKGVVILSGKTSGFIAGADIEQFVLLKNEAEAFELIRQAQEVFEKLASLRIPTVAMIRGFCLGGGLELALACRYRVVEDSSKTILGAPEVKLGLHPGWGGTIRLPELIGVRAAMRMNLSGHPVSAKEAGQIGLADAVVPDRDLERAARYYALEHPAKHQAPLLDRILANKALRPIMGKVLYKQLEKKVKRAHYPAPYAIVDNWVEYGTTGEKAMVHEAKSISHLILTDTSRNLVRVFFLQTRLKAQGKNVRFSVSHVHVAGAGTMGGDIAAWCALKGMRVTLQDRSPEFIAPAIKRAYSLFQKKLKVPRLVQAAMDRLIPDIEGKGVVEADIVIEAISENLGIKQAYYQMIEPHLQPHTILATNTSSLPLEELSKILSKPERLVGIHFFNPVAKMQLVEVVKGENTDPQIADQALSFVSGLDKLPLLVKSSPGFLINRILMPYLMEAMAMLEEGIAPSVIDKIAVDFGMPMGPIELADTVGLDVCLAVAEILLAHYGGKVPDRLKEMVEKKRLGVKSGQGFYTYKNGHKVKVSETPIEGPAKAKEINDRLILRMINESMACLREKVVTDADLLDAGMIFGTGFAPFRGGPMHYAQHLGMHYVVERLKELQKQFGDRFAPDLG